MPASDKAMSKVGAKCSPEALLKSLHTSFCSLQTPPGIVIDPNILMLMQRASTNAAVEGQLHNCQYQHLCIFKILDCKVFRKSRGHEWDLPSSYTRLGALTSTLT